MANEPKTEHAPSGKTYRKVSPTMFKFEKPGDELEGTLYHVDEVLMDTGPVKRYTVVTEDGEPLSFLGSSNLDVSLAPIEMGTQVLIRFVEVRTSSRNRNVKAFDVFTAS